MTARGCLIGGRAEVDRQTVRASSLVENLNSRLRNYFFLRRYLGPDYLALLQFFPNHRRFLRSERPERVGKSPAELLNGSPHPHWLEMLGYVRFSPQLTTRRQLSPTAIPYGQPSESAPVTQKRAELNQADRPTNSAEEPRLLGHRQSQRITASGEARTSGHGAGFWGICANLEKEETSGNANRKRVTYIRRRWIDVLRPRTGLRQSGVGAPVHIHFRL